jgi:hypothetical protein
MHRKTKDVGSPLISSEMGAAAHYSYPVKSKTSKNLPQLTAIIIK